ncbi:STAS domain-containing protein [Actinoplanes xinjiangensis]|uniref:STAS domain-containing protein n=1 Tax=Actinoplanes xinjiangensis TaxID=512350 RepID=UPI0034472017
MNVGSGTDDGVIVVSARGELDMQTADELDRALRAALTVPGATTVVADLAATTFCDSSGLEVLDRFYGDATAAGIRFRVDPVHPMVRRVLDITGLLDILTRP